MISNDVDDLFDVQFLGEDLLEIYGDAINEAVIETSHNQCKSLLFSSVPRSDSLCIIRAFPTATFSHSADNGAGATQVSSSNSHQLILDDFSGLVSPSIEDSIALSKSETVTPSHTQSVGTPKNSVKRKTPTSSNNGVIKKKKVSQKKDSVKSTNTEPKQVVTIKPSIVPSEPISSGSFMLTMSLPQSTLKSSGEAGETEFKTQAQAAVNEFLEKNQKEIPKSVDAIDTSTAHVKALTGDNWVTACAEVGNIEVDEIKSPNRSRRVNLTADERAKQNRDRNREHARNTRLRKKAYVEELKKTLLEVVAQRDAAELAKKQEVQRDQEQREVRRRVIQEFLKLRGHNNGNFARWSAILDENFLFTLPATPFRNMAGSLVEGKQTVHGVKQCMADAECLSTLLQSLGGNVTLLYTCDSHILMDCDCAALDWEAVTVGAQSETTFHGSIRCTFSPVTNKLVSLTMSFDSGFVAMQIGSAEVTVGSTSSAASVSKEDSTDGETMAQDKNDRVPSTIELKSPDCDLQ